MFEMSKDLKVSLRQLGRTPVFALSAIVVLALGIGLNAAMFGLSYALAFAARPFRAPEELVQLYSRNEKIPDSYRAFSYAGYKQIQTSNAAFDGVLAHNSTMVGVRDSDGPGESRRTFAALVSPNYFSVLGVPLQGRGFSADEDRVGAEIPVVVVSHSFWKRVGFDPQLIGRTIRINERPFSVIGISPPGFTGTMTVFGPELFFPFGVFDSLSNDFMGQANRSLDRPDVMNLFLVGRLKSGVSIAQAQDALRATSDTLRRAFPVEYKDQSLSAAALPRFGTSTSPSDESVITTLFALLLGMTGAVLLIVCLNLATMLLSRGQARRKEFAIRLALGGGRARIVRQLLIEGLLLSLVGGALGALLGAGALSGLVSALASRIPATIAIEASTSPMVVAGSVFFSIAATLFFALGPALRHSQASVIGDLKQQAGDEVPRKRRFLPRHPLVTLQVALSLSLLIAAGLFISMARATSESDLGYHADETVVAEVDASLGGYDATSGTALYASLEERLRALPGVRSASVGAILPLGGTRIGQSVRRAGLSVAPDAQPATAAAGKSFPGNWNAVGSSYFDAMGVALLAGRTFSDTETQRQGSTRVAILDEALAKNLFPDGDALGRQVEVVPEDGSSEAPRPMEVVGVVAGTKDDIFQKKPGGALYVPFAQDYRGNAFFHVRPAAGSGVAILDGVRREIRGTASLPLFRALTFKQHVTSSIDYWGIRMVASFFTAMGALAAFVALVGVYGVKSYAVSRRSREIGVRLAVGATPTRIRTMILKEGLHLGGTGVAIGLGLGLALGRALDAVFVDLAGFDWATFTIAPVLLLGACVFAAWIPAVKATAVDPSTVLRAP